MNRMQVIHVLLVEDDLLIRRLLEFYFEKMKPDYVIQFVDSSALVETCCMGNQVDFLLIDICNEKNVTNIEEAGYVKTRFPKLKVMLITDLPEYSFLEQAHRNGIESFWYKGTDLKEMLSIVERTMNGESIYPEQVPVVLLGDALSNDFSRRETDVLREVVAGETDAAIAEKLHISVRTVKGHIQSMREKTGFRNRTELAVCAREAGFVINKKRRRKN